jgi:hypothetical protein
MKPHRIFLLFCALFFLLGLISLVTPGNGINVTEGFVIRIPVVNDWLHPIEVSYPDIEKLTRNNRRDSVVAIRSKVTSDTISMQPAIAQFLEYPDSGRKALDPFFSILANLDTTGECIHILHYGDSQLEADHITEYLRFRFQEEFGGNGPGLIAPGSGSGRISLDAEASGNWTSYSLVGTPYSQQGKRSYGPLASYFRFTPIQDSVRPGGTRQEAWITFKETGKAFGKPQLFSRCRIFYANNKTPFTASFTRDGEQLRQDSLGPGSRLSTLVCNLGKPSSKLTITFSGTDSPDFYGLSLDEPSGICVDNIPLRGSSGMEFNRMDPGLLTAMLQKLNVRLLILQFGVNAIPGNLDDYSYYENGLVRQLSSLKKLSPDLCIIVIGVSDASRKVNDKYETYPSVEKIVAAEKNAAMRTGCIYWDLYRAMGGKNSMPGWVFAREPLASPDFFHFNYKGARLVGKMFYSALIHDYNEFLIRRK